MKKKTKNNLPKKIKLFGAVYTIMYMDKVPNDENKYLFGESDSVNKTIKISTKNRDGKPLPDREIWLTICHELVHMILDEGCYHNASDDEPMVEWIAKCILELKGQI